MVARALCEYDRRGTAQGPDSDTIDRENNPTKMWTWHIEPANVAIAAHAAYLTNLDSDYGELKDKIAAWEKFELGDKAPPPLRWQEAIDTIETLEARAETAEALLRAIVDPKPIEQPNGRSYSPSSLVQLGQDLAIERARKALTNR